MSEANVLRPDVSKEMGLLKDFQQKSVDAVFEKLYGKSRTTRRFLVADEVGLGKTLIARGLITKVIDHLWDTVQRIDIVYLCSNSDIARQNVDRLTPSGISGVSMAARITLLPLSTHNLKGRRVNVIALTPGTSLDLKDSMGLKRERAFLLHMLAGHWNLDWTGACKLFRGSAGLQKFKAYAKNFTSWEPNIDATLVAAFLTSLDKKCDAEKLAGTPTLRERTVALVKEFYDDSKRTTEQSQKQRRLIGELRQALGKACIEALEPDLIVLDEFQRFKHLLSGEGGAGEMAKQLFDYENEDVAAEARVLLLSATPYKMYTVSDEADGDDHYNDFLSTARFLLAEHPGQADELGRLLRAYRRELFSVGQDGLAQLDQTRAGIERILREVMIRTERLAVTSDRSGMLTERPVTGIELTKRDAKSYVEVQAISKAVKSVDAMEFWKSSPWLPNFMDDYKLRRDIDDELEKSERTTPVAKALGSAQHALLSVAKANTLDSLDPPHGRMKWLVNQTLGSELWRLLWLPPALPYHQMAEPFASVALRSPTKSLIFSAWRVVPRVIAATLSHEAERLMYRELDKDADNLEDTVLRNGGLLQVKRREGRAAGLTVLALLYPSQVLASACDPLVLSKALAGSLGRAPTVDELVAKAESVLEPLLKRVIEQVETSRATPDESWYWAAPILLDLRQDAKATTEWLEHDLVALWSGVESRKKRRVIDLEITNDDTDSSDGETEESAFADLVTRVRALVKGKLPAGSPPKDLLRSMALVALGGSANVALRSLARILPEDDGRSSASRDAAARVAGAFQTLFDQPDSSAVVRSSVRENDYWKQCVEYSTNGCLQAALDEYAHILVGDTGMVGRDSAAVSGAIADSMCSALSIRRASVTMQGFTPAGNGISREKVRMRSRFAVRYGEERADESGDKMRADDVRRAFNSPFWPFVLATTSVGQEGLDFHSYCHSVIHWNLPPNPVDLEQREGRVHRYKGHAVRKNVAKKHSDVWKSSKLNDPWEASFEAARSQRGKKDSDLVPYWVYPIDGGATIERHVPNWPLSRENERFELLKKSLVLYRMVFGQPRQEELLSYLRRVLPPDQIESVAERLRISLAP